MNTLRKISVAALVATSVWLVLWPRMMNWPDWPICVVFAWMLTLFAVMLQAVALDSMALRDASRARAIGEAPVAQAVNPQSGGEE